MMAAIPRQIKACEENNIRPLYAIELYCQPGHPSSKDDFSKMTSVEKKSIRKSYHLLAIAYNNTGYKNLVQLSSWAWLNGFYYRPRVNHEQLLKYKEGIIFTSCCYNSEIGQAFDKDGEDAGFAMIEKYRDYFGENFYLELMLLDFSKQKPYDAFIIKAHDKYHIPLIITNDCFVENTLVTTDQGLKFIQDIKVDDLVLTHNNRFRKVEIVGKRPLKDGEKVLRVCTSRGTYVFDATPNHKVRVAQKTSNIWKFDWKEVENLSQNDYLLVSMPKKSVFMAEEETKYLDLTKYLKENEYQIGDSYHSSNKGNLGNKLMLVNEEFVSYRGFDRKNQTKIPRKLPLDDDLIKVLGWYTAEGWSEKGKLQVGFALHSNEIHVANFLCNYFSRFGIKPKIYKVSENGIAVRFSSKVFNRFFGSVCGYGSNNKHIPFFGEKILTSKQYASILNGNLLGDGHSRDEECTFHSTSRTMIYEIATILLSVGIVGFPCVRLNENENWEDLWYITYGKERKEALLDWFSTGNIQNPSGHHIVILNDEIAVKFTKSIPIEYSGSVYDFQVEEDHSFVANLYKVSNCHYCEKEDSKYQRYMLMIQKETSIKEIEKKLSAEDKMDIFELQDSNLWMKSEIELNQKWMEMYQEVIPYDLFVQAKKNTVEICHKAKNVEIDRNLKLPQFPDADARLKDAIIAGAKWRGVHNKRKYVDRLKEEFELISRKGFSSYFLIQKQMTDEARRICPELIGWGDGSEAVGVGRGSAVGSLACFCLGITDVDPIRHNLMFSRFLSENRGGKTIKLKFTGKPKYIVV